MDEEMRFELHRLAGGERGRLLRVLYQQAEQNDDEETMALYHKLAEGREFYFGQWESDSGGWELPL